MRLCGKPLYFIICLVLVEVVAFHNSLGICNVLYQLQQGGRYVSVHTDEENSTAFDTKEMVDAKKESVSQSIIEMKEPVYERVQTQPPTQRPVVMQTTPPPLVVTGPPTKQKEGIAPVVEKKAEKDANVYDLILFTTEDDDLKPKTLNVLIMFRLFQQKYNFKGIFFTSNPDTIDTCKDFGVETVSDVWRNPYGMPFISGMFNQTYAMYNSLYYGYINADILVSERIFEVLPYVRRYRKIFRGRFIELGHNAYNVRPKQFDPDMTIEAYRAYFNTTLSKNPRQRGPSSIDMFILSKEYARFPLGEFVVARSMIDTYMMVYAIRNRGTIIDTGMAAPTIHQGLTTYTSRAKKAKGDDFNWNKNRIKGFSTLQACSGVIGIDGEGHFSMEKPFSGRRRDGVSLRKTKKRV